MKAEVVSVIFNRGTDPDSLKETVRARYPGSIVQTVRADAATNGFFIEMIAAQTLQANGTPCLLAKKPEVDLLLRLAGTTQISGAIEQVGARKEEPFLVVIAGSRRRPGKFEVSRLGGKELEKRELTTDELDRIERAALLNVRRPKLPV
jgi:tRNA threonylcarbamoyladenosine modification (KEOPS) complex Cgi121 subunit